MALDILRSLEDRLITDGVMPLVATTAVDVALYILNQKRVHLNDIQQRYRVPITVTADENMHVSQFVIERGAEGAVINGESAVVHMDWAHHTEETPTSEEQEGEQGHRRSRRRRRRRHGDSGVEAKKPDAVDMASEADEDEAVVENVEEIAGAGGETPPEQRKSRRRGRRGGRRGRGRGQDRTGGDTAAPREAHAGKELPHKSTETEAAYEFVALDSGEETAPRRQEELVGVTAGRDASAAEPIFNEGTLAREDVIEAPTRKTENENEPAVPRRKGWWSRGG